MRTAAAGLLTAVTCWSLIAAADRHVFHDPAFWAHFESRVRSGSYSCGFPSGFLLSSVEGDARLYPDPARFRARRAGAERWTRNDTLWIDVALGAARERADGVLGPYSKQLLDLRMLDAFTDYVDHLDYFQKVASVMKGVRPLSQDSSRVHDIDKLDPVMLVGYSERFEDQVETSLWDACVQRHTRVNPHHQAHCIWHDCCSIDGCDLHCDRIRRVALREMVCDKVSRGVQKTLAGKMGDEMWDLEEKWFEGMPREWIERAMDMMRRMKRES